MPRILGAQSKSAAKPKPEKQLKRRVRGRTNEKSDDTVLEPWELAIPTTVPSSTESVDTPIGYSAEPHVQVSMDTIARSMEVSVAGPEARVDSAK